MKTFATLALLGFASAVKLHSDSVYNNFETIFNELNEIWSILEKNGLWESPKY